jgi:general secretion pathway protein E
VVELFSQRFLRESSVFPFRTRDDGFGLAVSDPSDSAAIRAVEIVCGGAVAIAVASFDDIATVLELRLDEQATGC